MAKIATLVDPWAGATLSPARWYVEPISDNPSLNGQNSGTAVVSGGTLALSNGIDPDANYYTSVNSQNAYDLTSSAAFVRVLPYTTTTDPDTGWGLGDAGLDNGYSFGVTGGNLYIQSWSGGGDTQVFSATYSATSHKWLKIACSTNTLTFYASADGVTWGSALYSTTSVPGSGWTLTSAYVQLFYGSNSGSASPPGSGQFQDFNVLPSVPGAASLSGTGSLSAGGSGGSVAASAAFTAGTARAVLTEAGTPVLTEAGSPVLLEGGLAGATLAASATAGPPGNPAAFLSAVPALHASGSAFRPVNALSAAPVMRAAATAAHPGAPLAASPVLTAAPRVIVNDSVHLSAAPALTASGFVPVLLARPVLSASAKITHPGAAALHGAAALSAVTSASAAHLAASPSLLAPGRHAAARLLAGTSLTASGQYFMPGQAVLYAGTQLTAAARNAASAAAALRSSTALAAAALNRAVSSASLSASAHLAAVTSSSAAHLAAAATLAAAGRHTATAAAALHASPAASAAARVTERAAAAFYGSAALATGAVPSRVARSRLSAAAALSAAGAVHKEELGAAVLQAAAALRAAGLRATFGAARLAAAPALSAHGARTAVARAQLAAQAQVSSLGQDLPGVRLSASASLSGTAVLSRTGKALLSAGARLTGTAHGTTFPKAAFKAPGAFTPVPNGIVQGTVSLSCSPSLAASALTKPGLPFPLRPSKPQPTWQRDIQRFAVTQERQRHAQALWQYGELVVFALLWRPEDIGAGLARRCTRCYAPASVISDIAPETPLPLGWATAANEAQISAAYGQGNQFRCTLCYGTQVIAAGQAQVPGVRALIVRPAILTDTDQNQQRSAKGVVSTGQVAVQSTPDFRVNTLDYFFRSDGRRYQLAVPARTTLRTGFGSPWQASAAISYNLASAALEDPKASVAYVIPPSGQQVAQALGTYTRVPADYAWLEQVNGPLIPEEEPPPAASGEYQAPESLGV